MQQHDIGCRCQNRGLALPRLGGADEALCELTGVTAERQRRALVSGCSYGVGEVWLYLPSVCSGCSGARMGIRAGGLGGSPCRKARPLFPRPCETESLSV